MSANMKPQGGRNIRGPLLRGLTARSVTGKNGQAAKEEMSLRERGAGCRKNISDASAGRSVFHLTSLFIGLLVLERRNRQRRLQLSAFDRLLWVWLSRIWPTWESALRIVKPETVFAWHRRGFRLYWRWKSRPRHGRPPVATEVRELIRRISAANPGWGAPRIHGELGKLGITVSETTVAKYMVRHRYRLPRRGVPS